MAINSSRTGGTVGGITPTGQEVLTNKDIDGGSASNTNRITVPKGTATALAALTRKEGTTVYDTDAKGLYIDNGTDLVAVGSGTTARNYMGDNFDGNKAPGTLSLTGGTGNITVSNLTSAFYAATGQPTSALVKSTSTLLRRPVNYLTAVTSFDATGATVWDQFPAFTLDGVDLGKPTSISFDTTGNTIDGQWDAVIAHYNSSGTFIELISIAGNASGATVPSAKLPTGTVNFQGFFIPGSTSGDVYALRLRRLTSATDQIRIDSLYIGPQSVVQGAAVTNWQAFIPTFSTGAIDSTPSASQWYWRQNGSNMEMTANLIQDSAGTAGSGTYKITIPNGAVADSILNAGAGGAGSVLPGRMQVSTGSGTPVDHVVHLFSTTQISFQSIANVDWAAGVTPDLATTTLRLSFWTSIPISTWSSNVTMANRAVEEYASNGSAWGTSETALAANSNSISGATGGTSTPASTSFTYRVRFPSAIQATDKIFIELSGDRKNWSERGNYAGSVLIESIRYDGTNYIGVGYNTPPAATTDVDIIFGKYATGSTTAWTGTWYWRVRKVSGGASVGYPIGARNVVGDTTGTTVPTGYIGETITQAITSNLSTSAVGADTYVNSAQTLPLTVGKWMVTVSTNLYLLGNASWVAGGAYASIHLADADGSIYTRTSVSGWLSAAGASAITQPVMLIAFIDVTPSMTTNQKTLRLQIAAATTGSSASGFTTISYLNNQVLTGTTTYVSNKMTAIRIA